VLTTCASEQISAARHGRGNIDPVAEFSGRKREALEFGGRGGLRDLDAISQRLIEPDEGAGICQDKYSVLYGCPFLLRKRFREFVRINRDHDASEFAAPKPESIAQTYLPAVGAVHVFFPVYVVSTLSPSGFRRQTRQSRTQLPEGEPPLLVVGGVEHQRDFGDTIPIPLKPLAGPDQPS
jgi:hypothetical protein